MLVYRLHDIGSLAPFFQQSSILVSFLHVVSFSEMASKRDESHLKKYPWRSAIKCFDIFQYKSKKKEVALYNQEREEGSMTRARLFQSSSNNDTMKESYKRAERDETQYLYLMLNGIRGTLHVATRNCYSPFLSFSLFQKIFLFPNPKLFG